MCELGFQRISVQRSYHRDQILSLFYEEDYCTLYLILCASVHFQVLRRQIVSFPNKTSMIDPVIIIEIGFSLSSLL